uniref:Uncharacterized protein n=1 Tax=Knipowitschia caucasica TaxID=637954 RepID=A0AAV2L1L0_KNICA
MHYSLIGRHHSCQCDHHYHTVSPCESYPVSTYCQKYSITISEESAALEKAQISTAELAHNVSLIDGDSVVHHGPLSCKSCLLIRAG